MITMILKTLLCKIKKLLESSCTCFKLHGCDKFPTRRLWQHWQDTGFFMVRPFNLIMYQCCNKGTRFPWQYKARVRAKKGNVCSTCTCAQTLFCRLALKSPSCSADVSIYHLYPTTQYSSHGLII